MNDFAILVVWPEYPIEVSEGFSVEGLGHAGVVIVDGDTGITKYYEYGRYDKEELGSVRNRIIPNVTMLDGKIDGSSLKNMMSSLNSTAGKDNYAIGSILPLGEGGYDSAVAFAE